MLSRFATQEEACIPREKIAHTYTLQTRGMSPGISKPSRLTIGDLVSQVVIRSISVQAERSRSHFPVEHNDPSRKVSSYFDSDDPSRKTTLDNILNNALPVTDRVIGHQTRRSNRTQASDLHILWLPLRVGDGFTSATAGCVAQQNQKDHKRIQPNDHNERISSCPGERFPEQLETCFYTWPRAFFYGLHSQRSEFPCPRFIPRWTNSTPIHNYCGQLEGSRDCIKTMTMIFRIRIAIHRDPARIEFTPKGRMITARKRLEVLRNRLNPREGPRCSRSSEGLSESPEKGSRGSNTRGPVPHGTGVVRDWHSNHVFSQELVAKATEKLRCGSEVAALVVSCGPRCSVVESVLGSDKPSRRGSGSVGDGGGGSRCAFRPQRG